MADERVIQQGLAKPASEPVTEFYPDSDGRPMAENDTHYGAIRSIREPLASRYRGSADTYVSGDLLMYYRRYDPSQCVAPDVMVVVGTSPQERRSYRLWEEGKPPDFVVEVSSPDSYGHDSGPKRELLGRLDVREYLLFRPDYGGETGSGVVRLYRQWGGQLVEADPHGEVGGEPEYASEVLGVGFRADGNRVRLRDLESGRDLELPEEVEQARDTERQARGAAELRAEEERQAREAERQARDAAELRAEAERQARGAAELRAEAERQARGAAELRAEAEQQARKEAEARIAELEALLRGA